jgi:hypothetical protein
VLVKVYSDDADPVRHQQRTNDDLLKRHGE